MTDYELGRKQGGTGKYVLPEGVDKDDFDSGYNATKGSYDPNEKYLEAMMMVPETASVDYEAMYTAMADMYTKMSDMNEEKFNKYWPESMSQGIAAGQIYDKAGRAQSLQTTGFNQQLADISNAWAQKTAGQSNEWMMGQVGDVNKFNSEQFYAALEKAMPGMMDTVLNLGMNDNAVEGLAKKSNNPRFAWDSYRRFVQMYGDVVLGMKPASKEDPDPFEEILEKVKENKGYENDTELTVDDLKRTGDKI